MFEFQSRKLEQRKQDRLSCQIKPANDGGFQWLIKLHGKNFESVIHPSYEKCREELYQIGTKIEKIALGDQEEDTGGFVSENDDKWSWTINLCNINRSSPPYFPKEKCISELRKVAAVIWTP